MTTVACPSARIWNLSGFAHHGHVAGLHRLTWPTARRDSSPLPSGRRNSLACNLHAVVHLHLASALDTSRSATYRVA